MNQEPLPQIHLIRDTDLSVFAYELHILPEIFLENANSICVLWQQIPGLIPLPSWGKSHVAFRRLICLLFYGGSSSMILTTEFIGARAFLFHTDRSEGGHLYGDVLMMDLDTLRQDIKEISSIPAASILNAKMVQRLRSA